MRLCPYCQERPLFQRKQSEYAATCGRPECKSKMRSVTSKRVNRALIQKGWRPSDNYNAKRRADQPDLQITRVKRMIEGELRTVTIYAPKPPKRHKKTPTGRPAGDL